MGGNSALQGLNGASDIALDDAAIAPQPPYAFDVADVWRLRIEL